jgi:hypothetical protein
VGCLKYKCILCFFIRDWRQQRFTPYVSHFPDSHTGVNIKLKLDTMISGIGLAKPDVKKYVVNDNAANAVLAIKLAPDLNQVSTLNEIIISLNYLIIASHANTYLFLIPGTLRLPHGPALREPHAQDGGHRRLRDEDRHSEGEGAF